MKKTPAATKVTTSAHNGDDSTAGAGQHTLRKFRSTHAARCNTMQRRGTTGHKTQPNQALALMQQAQAAIKVAAKKRMANTSAQPSK